MQSNKDLKQQNGHKIVNKRLEGHRANLQHIREDIRIVKKIVCFWKAVYMKSYLEEKVCKKLSLLLGCKQKLIENEIILKDVEKYLATVMELTEEVKILPVVQDQVEEDIDKISRDPTLTDRMN